jgi:hypothetical protein
MTLKGYRTVALSAAVIVFGPLAGHINPELITRDIDVIFAVVGLAFLLLRLATDTPFGARVAADLGTTPAAVRSTLAAVAPDAPGDITTAILALKSAAQEGPAAPVPPETTSPDTPASPNTPASPETPEG